MAKTVSYRAVPIEKPTSALLGGSLAGAGKLVAATDVAHTKMMLGFGRRDGSPVKLVRFGSPTEADCLAVGRAPLHVPPGGDWLRPTSTVPDRRCHAGSRAACCTAALSQQAAGGREAGASGDGLSGALRRFIKRAVGRRVNTPPCTTPRSLPMRRLSRPPARRSGGRRARRHHATRSAQRGSTPGAPASTRRPASLARGGGRTSSTYPRTAPAQHRSWAAWTFRFPHDSPSPTLWARSDSPTMTGPLRESLSAPRSLVMGPVRCSAPRSTHAGLAG